MNETTLRDPLSKVVLAKYRVKGSNGSLKLHRPIEHEIVARYEFLSIDAERGDGHV